MLSFYRIKVDLFKKKKKSLGKPIIRNDFFYLLELKIIIFLFSETILRERKRKFRLILLFENLKINTVRKI